MYKVKINSSPILLLNFNPPKYPPLTVWYILLHSLTHTLTLTLHKEVFYTKGNIIQIILHLAFFNVARTYFLSKTFKDNLLLWWMLQYSLHRCPTMCLVISILIYSCFCLFTITNNMAINIFVQTPFCTSVFP